MKSNIQSCTSILSILHKYYKAYVHILKVLHVDLFFVDTITSLYAMMLSVDLVICNPEGSVSIGATIHLIRTSR